MHQSPGHNRCSVIVSCAYSFQIQEGIIPSLLNGWHFLPVVDDSAARVLCQQLDTLMACFNLSHSLSQVFNIPTLYWIPHLFSCAHIPSHGLAPAYVPICCLKLNVTDFFLIFFQNTPCLIYCDFADAIPSSLNACPCFSVYCMSSHHTISNS